MKKLMPLLILFFVLLCLAFYVTYDNARTDNAYKQSWELDSKYPKIEIYGTEQPVNLEIVNTDNTKTKLTISGNISKTAIKSIQSTKLSDSHLYVPLSKHGFRLYTASFGKDTLTVKVELAKDIKKYDVFLDTIVGEINVTVPKSFDGKYNVMLSSGAEIKEIPETNEKSDSTIKIDAYSDVTIRKGE